MGTAATWAVPLRSTYASRRQGVCASPPDRLRSRRAPRLKWETPLGSNLEPFCRARPAGFEANSSCSSGRAYLRPFLVKGNPAVQPESQSPSCRGGHSHNKTAVSTGKKNGRFNPLLVGEAIPTSPAQPRSYSNPTFQSPSRRGGHSHNTTGWATGGVGHVSIPFSSGRPFPRCTYARILGRWSG